MRPLWERKVASSNLAVRKALETTMPIKPKKDETEDEFIARCIPEEIRNGHSQPQAIAICYSKWKEKPKKKE